MLQIRGRLGLQDRQGLRATRDPLGLLGLQGLLATRDLLDLLVTLVQLGRLVILDRRVIPGQPERQDIQVQLV